MERSETHRPHSFAGAEPPGRLSLAALQEAMFVAATAGASNALLQAVSESRGICARQRLAAYRANVRGAHLNALQQSYPVVREVLGTRYWQQLLEEELQGFTTPAADLDAYGEFLPAVLRAAQQRRRELEGMPYLADLARLEWSVHTARFVRNDPSFDWQQFTALSAAQQSQAVLVPSHALAVFRSAYPVDVIWHAHQPVVQCLPESHMRIACCVHRVVRFDVMVTRISPANARLLAAVCKGASLEKLSAMATGEPPDGVINQFYGWIQRGWIVGFEVNECSTRRP